MLVAPHQERTSTMASYASCGVASTVKVWVRSFMSFLSCLVLLVLLVLERLGEALDALEPAVPRGAHRLELRERAGELLLVDPVVPLAAGRPPVHEPGPVEHRE